MPFLPVFYYYSDVVLWHQPWHGLVRFISVILFTVLPEPGLLGACRNGTVGFSCHDDRMRYNRKGALVPLVSKVLECVDEIKLS